MVPVTIYNIPLHKKWRSYEHTWPSSDWKRQRQSAKPKSDKRGREAKCRNPARAVEKAYSEDHER